MWPENPLCGGLPVGPVYDNAVFRPPRASVLPASKKLPGTLHANLAGPVSHVETTRLDSGSAAGACRIYSALVYALHLLHTEVHDISNLGKLLSATQQTQTVDKDRF